MTRGSREGIVAENTENFTFPVDVKQKLPPNLSRTFYKIS